MPIPVRGLSVPAHVLVTGASSGIGLALAADLLERPGVASVVAVSRHAGSSGEVQALADRHPGRLHAIDADLATDAGIALVAEALRARGHALHLVQHCAGLLHAEGMAPEKSLQQLERAALERVFALNAFAPILLARALQPLLGAGGPAVFASLSARVGSIGDNRLGGWHAYRASKAALNMIVRNFAIELAHRNPAALAVTLHPGTVATPLSAPFTARRDPADLFEPALAARQLLAVVDGLTPADSGGLFSWDGTRLPY